MPAEILSPLVCSCCVSLGDGYKADTTVHQQLDARRHWGNVSNCGRVFPSTEQCWEACRAHFPPPAKHPTRQLVVSGGAKKAGRERTWATAQIRLDGLKHTDLVTRTQGDQLTHSKWQRHHRGHWGISSTRHSFGPTIPLLTSLSRADTFPIAWMAFTCGALLGPRQGTSAKLSWPFSEGRNGGRNKARQRLR